MWIYEDKEVTSIQDLDAKCIGFVYLIIDGNNKYYIGQKSLFSKRKRRFGKKESAAITDKRKKTYEYVIKESDWMTYTGSNKELNDNIKNGIKYKKFILKLCYNKKQLLYYETKYLMANDAIEPGNNSYNANILGKFYPKDLL
jgi:hypothetical protein